LNFGLLNSFGQTNYGNLVMKINQDKNRLWYFSQVTSNDTVIDLYQNFYKTRTTHDSIPIGNYKLTLFSELGDRIDRNISIKNASKQSYDLKSFYFRDTSPVNFTDRLTSKDTLRIFIRESGCWHAFDFNCEVTKQDTSFYVHFATSKGKETYKLSRADLESIQNNEKTGRRQFINKTRPSYATTTQTTYYYSLDKKIIYFKFHRPNILSEILNHCRQQTAK
jgi:hypothetical protein